MRQLKINDFIFRFRGNGVISNAGICRVRTFLNAACEVYVVLSELNENPSTSVTNAVELLVSELIHQQKIPAQAKILEHYPKCTWFAERFDLVTFDQHNQPSWRSVSFAFVKKALECSDAEFDDYQKDKRVQKEIQNALNGIPKIEKFEYVEPFEITERRLAILQDQHSIEDVKKLLDTYPSERELSTFIKQDMSLLAECYACPSEEYIGFAEFPVGNGRVDFALFTGRSRMNVYLIELKGAQDNLCRQNHYHEFRSSIQEGRGQLIQRAMWCNQNYEKFRLFVHQVLKEVKNGRRPYHAFLGPKYRLEVDPNKDVRICYVLIGGRTGNDLSDSQKRHAEDLAVHPDMQTETWDSWVNKLTRGRP